ncbi:hypothetical protein ACJX0J_008971, partial [Zea mays]
MTQHTSISILAISLFGVFHLSISKNKPITITFVNLKEATFSLYAELMKWELDLFCNIIRKAFERKTQKNQMQPTTANGLIATIAYEGRRTRLFSLFTF